jgi:hypothetical protein
VESERHPKRDQCLDLISTDDSTEEYVFTDDVAQRLIAGTPLHLDHAVPQSTAHIAVVARTCERNEKT